MEAMDDYIPEPERAIDGAFPDAGGRRVLDLGSRHGGDGRIERGIVNVGDEVEIVGIKDTDEDDVHGRGDVPQAAGPGPGWRQRGRAAAWHEARRGGARPGAGEAGDSITPHTKFEAEVYILTKEEGGRHTPFFKGYRPQFYFRTTDVTGAVELPEGTEMVMPGDNVQMKVELIAPIAMEEGLRFAIREGGRTVGAGVVAKIIE